MQAILRPTPFMCVESEQCLHLKAGRYEKALLQIREVRDGRDPQNSIRDPCRALHTNARTEEGLEPSPKNYVHRCRNRLSVNRSIFGAVRSTLILGSKTEFRLTSGTYARRKDRQRPSKLLCYALQAWGKSTRGCPRQVKKDSRSTLASLWHE